MNSPYRNCLRILTLLGILFLLAVTTGWVMKRVEEKKMNEWVLAMPMKTVCLGRFLIDIPADSPVSFGQAFRAGWRISAIASETAERYSVRLETRETELRVAKNEKGWDSLESVMKVDTKDVQAKIFIHQRKWNYGIENGKRVDYENVAIEAIAHAGQTSYVISADLIDVIDANELAQLIKQIRPRTNDEVPSEPGFCFDGGIIRDPFHASLGESTVLFVGLKNHPDVAIALDTHAGIEIGETLFQRDAKNDIRQQYASHFHVLRRGKRALNGIPGEEILDRVNEPNGSTLHGFMWESLSKKDDVLLPHLSLELDTGKGRPGKPVNSSLSDAAVLALWDRISSSLRVRPVAEPVAEAPQPPPHAKRVYADQPCPATGWWSCDDGANEFAVQGGARQFFRQGVRMPQAVLLGPPTVWQKMKGQRPTFNREAPTLWNWSATEPAIPTDGPEKKPSRES